jgi:PAS domain S-box-containing protein
MVFVPPTRPWFSRCTAVSSSKLFMLESPHRAPLGRVHDGIRRALIGAIVAAGAAVLLLSIRDLILHGVESRWFVLVGLTLITGWSTLRMRVVPISFSISDTFTIAAALLFGPAAGTVIVVIDALVMSLRVAHTNRTGMSPVRVVFNATAPALAMWLAAHTFFAITGTGPLASQPGAIRDVVGALATFAAMYFLLSTIFVAIAIAYERRQRIAVVWREYLSALWLTYFSGASIGGALVLMTVAHFVDVTTAMLILPLLLLLHVTSHASIDRMLEKVEHFATIASYEAALRSTADAVLVTDRSHRVTLMNPAAERLTGWTEDEAVGRPGADVFRALDTVTRGGDNAPPREGESTVRERVLVRRDGTESPIEEMQAHVRERSGDVVGVIKTFRDVSHRKAVDAERDALLESERRARAAADAALRLKDEFLTTLSHELRTPATGILGWVRLLKTGRLDEAQTRRGLEALERSTRAQAVLLDDLLDMSHIVRGTLRLDLRPTDVRDALNSAIETIRPAISSKGIDLRTEIPAGEFPAVQADSDRLRQVFSNLLSNAVKFTDRGGSICASIVQDPDQVRVAVSDNGVGIDLESQLIIFDRFRQADGSTTRLHGGLGVGLAIVRHVIELHGGTVTAASEGHGRGARFTVYLPTLAPAAQSGRLDAAS